MVNDREVVVADSSQLPEYDFSQGFAVCLSCGCSDFLHRLDCPVVAPGGPGASK